MSNIRIIVSNSALTILVHLRDRGRPRESCSCLLCYDIILYWSCFAYHISYDTVFVLYVLFVLHLRDRGRPWEQGYSLSLSLLVLSLVLLVLLASYYHYYHYYHHHYYYYHHYHYHYD